jgi:hypothetical protein
MMLDGETPHWCFWYMASCRLAVRLACSGASSGFMPWKDHSGYRLEHVLKRICRVVLVVFAAVCTWWAGVEAQVGQRSA